MSNSVRPPFDISENGKTIINDPKLGAYYEAGFRLAINYLHLNLPEEGGDEMNRKNFKNLVGAVLNEVEVEDDFFERNPILPSNLNYPIGLCPGPSGTCIDCPDTGFAG